MSLPLPNIENAKMIYPAPLGKFIIKTEKSIVFYDTILKKSNALIETSKTVK